MPNGGFGQRKVLPVREAITGNDGKHEDDVEYSEAILDRVVQPCDCVSQFRHGGRNGRGTRTPGIRRRTPVVPCHGEMFMRMGHRPAALLSFAVFGLAACSDQPVVAPQPTLDITVQQRDVELVRFHEAINHQRVSFPQTVTRIRQKHPHELPRIAPRVYTGASFESRGTLAPPTVNGTAVQLTDVEVVTRDGSTTAYSVSNSAGAVTAGAVQIFDLDDPFAPAQRSEVLVGDAEYAAVAVHGDALYATGNDDMSAIVDVFDVGNPDAPAHRARIAVTGQVVVAAHVVDDALHVVTGREGGWIRFDLSEPFDPVQEALVEIDDARDLVVTDDTALVLAGDGVHVVVGDASVEIIALEGLPTEAPTRGHWIDGAWYVNTNTGVWRIDPSTRLAGRVFDDTTGTANGLSSDGDRLIFRANGEAGLQLVHRSDTGTFRPLGWLDLANAGSANSAATGEEFLVSGDGRGGLLLAAFQYDVFENFEGDLVQPYPWVEVSGDWQILEKDGSLRFTCPRSGNPGDRRAFWGTDAPWTDFQVDAKVWLDQSNGCGIYFRAGDVWDDDEQDAYVFQYDPGYGRGAFLFRRIDDGRETSPLAVTYKEDVPELADVDWYEVWRDIRIRVEGDRMRAWVDGVFTVEATDDELTQGSIGVRAWSNSQPWFDDFRVTGID